MKIPTVEWTETAATGETVATVERVETAVEVKLTGHVRSAADTRRTESVLESEALRAFLETLFAAYNVRDLVIVEREADATTREWTRVDRPPGAWRKNPEGEQTRLYARVLVNDVFNESLSDLDARFEGSDRVALMKPFLYCVRAVIPVRGPSDMIAGRPNTRPPQN